FSLTVDAADNVWVVNPSGPSGSGGGGCLGRACGSVSELTASSGYSTGLNFAPVGAAFFFSDFLAFDATGNVWVSNSEGPAGNEECDFGCGSLSELLAAGGYSTGLNFSAAITGFEFPGPLTVDSASNVWVANLRGVSELFASDAYATGQNFAL